MRLSTLTLAAGLSAAGGLATAQESLTNPIGGARPKYEPFTVPQNPVPKPAPTPKPLTPAEILVECARQLAAGAETCTVPGR